MDHPKISLITTNGLIKNLSY